jgi:hypothetical protein
MISKGKATCALFLSSTLALAACGSEPTAAASAQVGARSNSVSPARSSPAVVPTQMPSSAFAAWRTFASDVCARSKLRFASPRLVRFVNFERTPSGFIPADFNGDGQPDFIVITPNEGCADDGPSSYGTHGGPPTNFIVSSPAGYRAFQGFGGYASPDMIERRGDRDVLNLSFGRNINGRCGPVAAAIWGWANNMITVIERRNPAGQIVDQEGCAARVGASPARAQANVGGLPIRTGYYAVNEPNCVAAMRSSTAGVVIDNRFLRDIDGDFPITPVRSLGNNRYRMGEAFQSLRIISGESFVADEGKEYQRRFLWCAERAPR